MYKFKIATTALGLICSLDAFSSNEEADFDRDLQEAIRLSISQNDVSHDNSRLIQEQDQDYQASLVADQMAAISRLIQNRTNQQERLQTCQNRVTERTRDINDALEEIIVITQRLQSPNSPLSILQSRLNLLNSSLTSLREANQQDNETSLQLNRELALTQQNITELERIVNQTSCPEVHTNNPAATMQAISSNFGERQDMTTSQAVSNQDDLELALALREDELSQLEQASLLLALQLQNEGSPAQDFNPPNEEQLNLDRDVASAFAAQDLLDSEQASLLLAQQLQNSQDANSAEDLNNQMQALSPRFIQNNNNSPFTMANCPNLRCVDFFRILTDENKRGLADLKPRIENMIAQGRAYDVHAFNAIIKNYCLDILNASRALGLKEDYAITDSIVILRQLRSECLNQNMQGFAEEEIIKLQNYLKSCNRNTIENETGLSPLALLSFCISYLQKSPNKETDVYYFLFGLKENTLEQGGCFQGYVGRMAAFNLRFILNLISAENEILSQRHN